MIGCLLLTLEMVRLIYRDPWLLHLVPMKTIRWLMMQRLRTLLRANSGKSDLKIVWHALLYFV